MIFSANHVYSVLFYKGQPNSLEQKFSLFNPLNAELNPICYLLALLGAHHIFHISGIRFNKYS